MPKSDRMTKQMEAQDVHLRAVFDAVDTDRSNSISEAELALALQRLGLDSAMAKAMVKESDLDSSGELEFDEFCRSMCSHFDSKHWGNWRQASSEASPAPGMREVFQTFDEDNSGSIGPSREKSASRSLRRALLMPQVNAGSLYRCGKGLRLRPTLPQR